VRPRVRHSAEKLEPLIFSLSHPTQHPADPLKHFERSWVQTEPGVAEALAFVFC
jgi:hypothetical protein